MLIFDTETTGLLMPEVADLAAQPHIIEIALVRLSEDDYSEVEHFTSLLKPGIDIDEELHKKITGLKNADLADQPSFLELHAKLADFCLGERTIVAHNLAFDMGVLTVELKRLGLETAFPFPPQQICTVQRTLHIKGRRMKQTELYEHVLKKPLVQTHRVLDDARGLAEIVRKVRLTWK